MKLITLLKEKGIHVYDLFTEYKMDFLTCREKDPLYTKYSTFPGWHSSHIYQHKPFTATRPQYLSEYKRSTGEPKTWGASGTRTTQDIYDFNKETEMPSIANFFPHTKLSHKDLSDYIGEVRNRVPIEKQRSDKGRYAERDQGWDNTWPINYREIREANSHNEMQAYAECYHHTLSKKTPRFEVGEWRSSRCASDMGRGQWAEQFQPSQEKDKTELLGEQWWKWSPQKSKNSESVGSFRQPPSYMAPPAYSYPKRAGTPKPTNGAFQEQTSESRNLLFTNLTETQCDPTSNNGYYLQKNIESYHSDITALNASTIMQYPPINTKPQLQYREFPQPDITQMKQTKLPRRKGGETVFCLVSRMGEVSGLSSSPEEPLKSHVLPLLTHCKPDFKTITTEQTNSRQISDDCRQNQQTKCLKDKAVGQLDGSLMVVEYGQAPLDQGFSSIQDLGNAIDPGENKEEWQCCIKENDSESNGLAQKSTMTDGACRESIEKFPLWKAPQYQRHSTGDMTKQTSQGINDEPEVTNEHQQSIVLIDTTCVVVKVELVLLPEKEHVQYVCLTEESPSLGAREETEEQKQHSSAASSQETPENNSFDERVEGVLGITHEPPITSVQAHKNVSEEYDCSCESHIVDPVRDFEQSPSMAAIVNEEQENELGCSQRETALGSDDCVEETLNIMKAEEQTTAQDPQVVLEDFEAFTSEKHAPEKTSIDLIQLTEQEYGPALDDSVVGHSTQKDNENQTDAKDPPEHGLTEDIISDDKQTIVSDCSTSVLWESAEHCIRVALPFRVGSRTLRRSSSSPHLSFTSAFNTLDISDTSPVVSHTEIEPLLPPSLTNSESTQCSGSPSVQSSSPPSPSSFPLPEAFEDSSLPQTANIPSDVLPCERKQKLQHAECLWDAVSRIRRHTAPDSETEDEEHSGSADNDLLYQTINTEEEEESEDNTLDN